AKPNKHFSQTESSHSYTSFGLLVSLNLRIMIHGVVNDIIKEPNAKLYSLGKFIPLYLTLTDGAFNKPGEINVPQIADSVCWKWLFTAWIRATQLVEVVAIRFLITSFKKHNSRLRRSPSRLNDLIPNIARFNGLIHLYGITFGFPCLNVSIPFSFIYIIRNSFVIRKLKLPISIFFNRRHKVV